MGIEAAITLAIANATGSIAFGIVVGSVISSGLVSVGLGVLSSALSPKPKTPNLSGSFSNKAAGITQNIKQPVTVRRKIYGEVRVGGALTAIETTDDDQYIHMILCLADHECQEIGEIWFDDISIPPDYIDGSGNVTSGAFSGFARIKKYLGAAGQVADPDLVSETTLGSTHVGVGMTYIYARLKFDRNVYPTSVPVITAFVKGAKIYDPRVANPALATRWSPYGPLFVRDYLTSALDDLVPGAGVATSAIDDTYLTAAINVALEMVDTAAVVETSTTNDPATDIITLASANDTLVFQTGDRVQLTTSGALPTGLALATNYYVIPYQRKTTKRIKLASSLNNARAGTAVNFTTTGSGTMTITKNAEPRYFGGGVIESDQSVGENLKDLLSTFGGDIIYIGGLWKIKAASYATPVFTFDESHLVSAISVRTKTSRRDRFNLIKGVYVSPLNDGEPADYPPVTNATYVTEDNAKTIPIDYDLPMTQRPHTAMRLAKIKLERSRQELFFEATFNLAAMQVQPGDVVYITNSRMGWSSKVFEVIKWTLTSESQDGVPIFLVKMSLQETASTVYDWNSGEETSVDPAPNTSLPNPRVVAAPTSLAVYPTEIPTASGDLTYQFLITWVSPADIFVTNGGHFDIQFKETSATDWERSFRAEDEDTSITVKQVKPGVNYDCRVRSVNQIGVRSSWQSLFGFTVSSPSGATIILDYGLITGAVVDTIDYGLITDAVVDSNDYGSIT